MTCYFFRWLYPQLRNNPSSCWVEDGPLYRPRLQRNCCSCHALPLRSGTFASPCRKPVGILPSPGNRVVISKCPKALQQEDESQGVEGEEGTGESSEACRKALHPSPLWRPLPAKPVIIKVGSRSLFLSLKVKAWDHLPPSLRPLTKWSQPQPPTQANPMKRRKKVHQVRSDDDGLLQSPKSLRMRAPAVNNLKLLLQAQRHTATGNLIQPKWTSIAIWKLREMTRTQVSLA